PLAGLVARALAKKPEDRYPDANALALDLERFLAGELVKPPSPRTRGPLLVVGAALALGVIAAVALGRTSAPIGSVARTPEDPALVREREGDARLAANDPRGAEAAYTEALGLDPR